MKRFVTICALGAMLATGSSLSALAGDAPVMRAETSLGTVWADKHGMTLYTFKKDEDGKSNCYDKCAKAWPPLMAGYGAMASDGFSLVNRRDGGKQWAYKGMPLYGWIKDKKPGDVTGHGFKDVWSVAKP